MIATTTFLTMQQLEAGLALIRQSPKDHGRLEMIVRRPERETREVIEEAVLDLDHGLVGDSWLSRRNPTKQGGMVDRENQLTLMNARAIALLAQEKSRWPLAGDQLFLDLDLSDENLPPGSILALGSAVIQITAVPHTGCKKFNARFGPDAVKFVNSKVGKELHLRGVNAKVLRGGMVRVGDLARRYQAELFASQD